MGFSFGVEELRLVDGTVVHPPADGMTVFIGPNNSGKSVLLRDLANLISHYPGTVSPLRWVSQVSPRAEGTAADLLAYLHSVGTTPRVDPHGGGPRYPSGRHDDLQGNEQGIPAEHLTLQWDRGVYRDISALLLSPQWTEDRLQDQTTSRPWNRSFPPTHPTQYLRSAPNALKEFSKLVENAFGKPISMDRYDHQQIRLTIGDPKLPEGTDPGSDEHWDAYSQLPGVREQGDGFRSFVNILLTALVRPAPIIVIDEPEAFLHPPQARLLGRYLAEKVPSPCQVFVATHSSDFLAGVLEANSKEVSLVRLTRLDAVAKARTLNAGEVESILRTPLLRYANIISGLFHDGVVLCESENDCQFYAATIDVINNGGLHDNLVFLPTNGKDRLADTARRLRSCGIPTAVIADLDLLNEATKIQRAVEALGGTWADIKTDVETLRRHLTDERIVPSAQSVKEQVNVILAHAKQGQTLTEDQCDKISILLKSSNSWRSLKKTGLNFLSGAPYNAAKRVIDHCAAIGLFLVPVGELESWIREIETQKKPAWFAAAFEMGHYLKPSAELRRFCQQITAYLVAGDLIGEPIRNAGGGADAVS
ncbi:ATP-dependent endonuclease [Streptomyces sp. NPDC058612]|uniref:ATP-dependent nuclease n=1 Tax=Streptomyces sp. NPDC058612 TaxID=3346555 RepID=UPI00365D4B10